MQPEVEAAVRQLVRDGVLTPEQGAVPLRVARGELRSLRLELRALLWLGVTLLATGVGLLVRENLDRIGPLAIAIALGVAAFACLAWVVRVAPGFSWREAPSPHLAFDYVLLLGVTLVGADLAFVEVTFTPLGAAWPWHLAWTSLLYAVLAVRFDSRMVFSLALTTFAAWRGTALRSAFSAALGAVGAVGGATAAWEVRANAIGCGAAFVLLGWLLLRFERKPHFEPVAVHMGWLLLLGGLASGIGSHADGTWAVWTLALLIGGGGLAFFAARAARFWLFAMGVAGAYAAISRLVVDAVSNGEVARWWFLLSAVAVVVLLVVAQRRLSERG